MAKVILDANAVLVAVEKAIEATTPRPGFSRSPSREDDYRANIHRAASWVIAHPFAKGYVGLSLDEIAAIQSHLT